MSRRGWPLQNLGDGSRRARSGRPASSVLTIPSPAPAMPPPVRAESAGEPSGSPPLPTGRSRGNAGRAVTDSPCHPVGTLAEAAGAGGEESSRAAVPGAQHSGGEAARDPTVALQAAVAVSAVGKAAKTGTGTTVLDGA